MKKNRRAEDNMEDDELFNQLMGNGWTTKELIVRMYISFDRHWRKTDVKVNFNTKFAWTFIGIFIAGFVGGIIGAIVNFIIHLGGGG